MYVPQYYPIMQIVIKTLKYIGSQTVAHQQFKKFQNEFGSEYGDFSVMSNDVKAVF